jgi:hypothetical protein
MYDHLILEDGMWEGHAGPTGSFTMRIPSRMPHPTDYQTPRERALAASGHFQVAVGPDSSPGPRHTVISSQTTIAWRATLDPIKQEMRKSYPWIEFAEFDLYPDEKDLVSRMVGEDQGDGLLEGRIADEFSRKLVIENADHSLVMGSTLRAAVSLDKLHRQVLNARLARGQAMPVFGSNALEIVLPEVHRLTWEDVDSVRKSRGMANMRVLLAEIEEAAWSEADGGRRLEEAVFRRYANKILHEESRYRPSYRGVVRTLAISVVVSVLAGPLPIVAGVALGAAQVAGGAAAAEHRYRSSWLATVNRLKRVSPPGDP